MRYGRRPAIFDKQVMQQGLIEAGCPEAFADAYLGDLKLFVPLVLRELGPQQMLEIVTRARPELGLKDEDSYWKDGAKYFSRWATNAIEGTSRRRECPNHAFRISSPPSTTRAAPLMKLAAGSERLSVAWATSSGSP